MATCRRTAVRDPGIPAFAPTCRSPHADIRTEAHRYNQRLRKLPERPGPVGNHPWPDALEAGLV
jgi:hypothetical protein